MSWIMIDIEADGPIPGDYSMIEIGAVIIDHHLDKTFYRRIMPISEKYHPEALAVSGYSREETLGFQDAAKVMKEFSDWIEQNSEGKAIFISDNNGFDAMFVTWYFHHFIGHNPFGHSSFNLGSFYKGVVKNCFENFKHLRGTPHTHNALDDARGNAEAFLAVIREHDVKIRF